MIAALLAVGYKSKEIKDELEKLNYNDFKDEGKLSKFGIIGKVINVIFKYGMYKGDFLKIGWKAY